MCFHEKIVLQASTTKTRNFNAFFSPSKSSYLLKIEQKSIFVHKNPPFSTLEVEIIPTMHPEF